MGHIVINTGILFLENRQTSLQSLQPKLKCTISGSFRTLTATNTNYESVCALGLLLLLFIKVYICLFVSVHANECWLPKSANDVSDWMERSTIQLLSSSYLVLSLFPFKNSYFLYFCLVHSACFAHLLSLPVITFFSCLFSLSSLSAFRVLVFLPMSLLLLLSQARCCACVQMPAGRDFRNLDQRGEV